MKAHRFLLVAGLALSVLFSSCKKDDVLPRTPTPPVTDTPTDGSKDAPNNNGGTPPAENPGNQPSPGNGTLLTQMGDIQLAYDAQGRLVKVSYATFSYQGYDVVYEGDKPVRLNYKTGGYLVYTYEGDKIVAATAYYGDNLVNHRYRFEYDGDKLVKLAHILYTRSDEGMLVVNRYSYDSNGNLSQIAVAGTNGTNEANLSNPTFITYGDYDNHTNPKPYAESELYLPGVKLFVNNPGYREASGYRELYTYTYAENGMPTDRYAKLDTHPQVPAVVTRYLYQ